LHLDSFASRRGRFGPGRPFVPARHSSSIQQNLGSGIQRKFITINSYIIRNYSNCLNYLQLRDDWNDLIELIINKSMRYFTHHRYTETLPSNPNNPQKIKDSASHSMDILPLKYSDEKTIEESTETNQWSYEVPDTNIKSLLIQLKDSGAFQSIF
jgi:hypothetical protein